MTKFNNFHSIIIILTLSVAIVITIFTFRYCGSGITINASISDYTIPAGEPFIYSDSTQNATRWLWEFGNNVSSAVRAGEYAFPKPGRYSIRLTINDRYRKFFTVDVLDKKQGHESKITEIEAPATALQGELIVFNGIGDNQQWRWEFGESGVVDSREKSPIYAYNQTGIYQVKLSTEFTQYPVIHQIEITPQYMGDENEDTINAIGADIREKLQAISDGKSFNINYNYIIDTYMCGNEKTEVIINNSKYNTIYSYCQGIGMTGKGKLIIEQVLAEIPDPKTGLVKKLTVIQTDKQNSPISF